MGPPCSIVLLLIRTKHEWLGYEVLPTDKIEGVLPAQGAAAENGDRVMRILFILVEGWVRKTRAEMRVLWCAHAASSCQVVRVRAVRKTDPSFGRAA